MNQTKMDHEWQELEMRINKFVHQYLKNEVPAIEYKPRNLALLQLSQEQQNKEIENVL